MDNENLTMPSPIDAADNQAVDQMTANQIDTCAADEADEQTSLAPAEANARLLRGEMITNVRIERMMFHGEYPEPVVLRNVTFVRPCFKKATFKKDAHFIGCTFDRLQVTRSVVCEGSLTLSGSTFIKAVWQNLHVKGAVKANNLKTEGRFLVNRSRFGGDINFWESSFHGWIDFKECVFEKTFDFRSCHVHEGLVLTRSQFQGDALFRGTMVAKKWEATNKTRFEKVLDFSKAKLNDYVYLESIEQGPGQAFAFRNTLGERILVRPEQVDGRLASEKEGRYEDAMHEYAFLKRAYSALHRYEHEDWAFYRFKVNQRRGKSRSWWQPWSKAAQFCDWLLLDLGCGYCTNPTRAIKTSLIILVGFACIYAVGIDHFHIDKVPFEHLDKTAWPNRIAYSLVTSVAVFTSGLSGIKDIAKDWMNIPLVIEALLGTLLWGLFIVAFSRKVIR